MTKSRILDLLGGAALALPAALDRALTANECAKYVLSLLQMAAGHADAPDRPATSLSAERIACGIGETCLDHVAENAMSDGKGNYAIPEGKRLRQILNASLHAMLAPLALADDAPTRSSGFEARLAQLEPVLAELEQELVSGETIAALTSGRPVSGDGLHLLVMDLHKELNRARCRCRRGRCRRREGRSSICA